MATGLGGRMDSNIDQDNLNPKPLPEIAIYISVYRFM